MFRMEKANSADPFVEGISTITKFGIAVSKEKIKRGFSKERDPLLFLKSDFNLKTIIKPNGKAGKNNGL